MKKSELERELKECGWYFDKQCGNHERWTNGDLFVMVPRHQGKDLAKGTAKSILKIAKLNRRK